MSKKKKQKTQQNLPLRERLAKHWRNRKWGAFVSLYLRDRGLSEQTEWAARWHDGLYNCMTQALFVDGDLESAREAAKLILAEAKEGGAGDDVLLDCARNVVDFLHYDERAGELSPLAGDGLPEPYATLRHKLEALAGGKRREKAREKGGVEDLAEKLASQFAALPMAKNLTPFTNFLKTADELAAATAASPAGNTFRAIRAIAELLRTLHRKDAAGAAMREIWRVERIRNIPPGQAHPAVFGLWDYFCRDGGRKYGREWELTARVLTLSFREEDKTFEPFRAAYEKLLRLPANACVLDQVVTIEKLYRESSEPERYTLLAIAIHESMVKNPDWLLDMDSRYLLHIFQSFAQIGRKWRLGNPWDRKIRDAFDCILFNRDIDLAPYLADFDLPFEAMAPSSLVLLTLTSRGTSQKIKQLLASRPPLSLHTKDIRRLAELFQQSNPPLEALRAVGAILDAASFGSLLSEWLSEVLDDSLCSILDEEPGCMWDKISNGVLKLAAESIPREDPQGRFCALCLDGGKHRLTKDEEKIEAFFAAIETAKGNAFCFGTMLFAFLSTWPEVAPEFLLRLLRAMIPHFMQTPGDDSYWHDVAWLVEKMTNKASKTLLIAGALEAFQEIPARIRKPGSFIGEAVRLFTLLKKGQKIDRPKAWPDDLDEIIEAMFREEEKREPEKRKTRGGRAKENANARQRTLDFDEEEDVPF